MTEAEILANIALINQAISDILQAGERYEIGTGPSKRITEMPDLDKLYKQKAYLTQDLEAIRGTSGTLLWY